MACGGGIVICLYVGGERYKDKRKEIKGFIMV
jgi:hypothetical protein